jgi:hypothetical protein
MQTRPAKAMPLELVIFDMDQVLCRYDRPLRLRRLAALSARTPEEIFAASASAWDMR